MKRTDTMDEAWLVAVLALPTQKARVRKVLESLGPLTCSEVEEVLRGTHQGISATLNALVAAGLARDTGERRENVRGFRERVLEACDVDPPEEKDRNMGTGWCLRTLSGAPATDGPRILLWKDAQSARQHFAASFGATPVEVELRVILREAQGS